MAWTGLGSMPAGNVPGAHEVAPRVMIEVTDATFQADVVERSHDHPVIIDLWAPWCGPCKTLGPMLERIIDEQGGQIVGVKANVDENPGISQAFQVQSIPAVYALKDGKVVDGFMGAQGEAIVRDFVTRLLPTEEETAVSRLVESGDEASLRQALELEPDNGDAVVELAELLVDDGRGDEALELLARIPETAVTRNLAARARTGDEALDDVDAELEELLGRAKEDEDARQKFIDLLEMLGPDDPRTSEWRRRLSSALF
jgi:putative thioredoxin